MGMTWEKGRRVAYAMLMVGALAIASGANYYDNWASFWNYIW
jgi:hypothetical protein